MIIQAHNAIKSNVKINCMSNKHDALRKLKLKAISIKVAIKTKIYKSTKDNYVLN